MISNVLKMSFSKLSAYFIPEQNRAQAWGAIYCRKTMKVIKYLLLFEHVPKI